MPRARARHPTTRQTPTPTARAPTTPPPQSQTVSPPATGRRTPLWAKALGGVAALAALVVVLEQVWPDWRMTQQGVNGYNIVQADYGSGRFVQTADGRWNEVKATGETLFPFRETRRDEGSVYLCDRGRDAGIQLDLNRDVVTYSESCATPLPWPTIFQITAVWRKIGP